MGLRRLRGLSNLGWGAHYHGCAPMGPSFVENKLIFIKINVRLMEAVRGVKPLNDVDSRRWDGDRLRVS